MSSGKEMPETWDGARYDKVADPQHRWGQAVLDRLQLSGDETVLDAGCGSGRITAELLERLPEGKVIGLDASASMLEQAKARLAPFAERAHLLQGSLLNLSPKMLGAHTPLDAVLSTATFHWVTDHDRLFTNLATVLRPGGQLVAQCGARGNIDRVLRAVRALGVERAGIWYYASPEETTRRLRRAGFKDLEVWTHLEPTMFPSEEKLIEFLEAVCLHEHLAILPPEQRGTFARRVAEQMGEPMIDYVRLNIVARRSSR